MQVFGLKSNYFYYYGDKYYREFKIGDIDRQDLGYLDGFGLVQFRQVFLESNS